MGERDRALAGRIDGWGSWHLSRAKTPGKIAAQIGEGIRQQVFVGLLLGATVRGWFHR
jgi:hypothetical protein